MVCALLAGSRIDFNQRFSAGEREKPATTQQVFYTYFSDENLAG
jgi:hypothetical protein